MNKYIYKSKTTGRMVEVPEKINNPDLELVQVIRMGQMNPKQIKRK